MTVGAAAVQTDTQKMSNWARKKTTRSVKAVGAANIPETSHFTKPIDEVQMRSKVGDRMSQERYRNVPCPLVMNILFLRALKINKGNRK